jgi:hypothetical protein
MQVSHLRLGHLNLVSHLLDCINTHPAIPSEWYDLRVDDLADQRVLAVRRSLACDTAIYGTVDIGRTLAAMAVTIVALLMRRSSAVILAFGLGLVVPYVALFAYGWPPRITVRFLDFIGNALLLWIAVVGPPVGLAYVLRRYWLVQVPSLLIRGVAVLGFPPRSQ